MHKKEVINGPRLRLAIATRILATQFTSDGWLFEDRLSKHNTKIEQAILNSLLIADVLITANEKLYGEKENT